MSNIRLIFENPWLWFVIIPLLAFALWAHFRVTKKFRRTRNRIVSLTLYILVSILAVSIISGTAIAYEKRNEDNEVLILVDASFSIADKTDSDNNQIGENSIEEKKNEFIKSIIDSNDGTFSVGVVTFAREPIYAAKLSTDSEKVYQEYLDSPKHKDVSATNISLALNFARELFEFEDSGKKIILISDGIQTDGKNLLSVVPFIKDEIKVDVVYFNQEFEWSEIQVDEIVMPNHAINIGQSAKLHIKIQSNFDGPISMILHDNDTVLPPKNYTITAGEHMIPYDYTFTYSGAHQLYVEIISNQDTILNNNHYYTYVFLDVYDKILVLDKEEESKELLNVIKDQYTFPVESRDINKAPNTLTELSEYDQVILMNIANEDMPIGFVQLLYTYVNELGGGLLTIGGNRSGLQEANTYRREDMNPNEEPSLYQEMLPVDCIDYYPPLALMLVIDRSGSMNEGDDVAGKPRISVAKEAAKKCVEALSERDYIGIVTFSDKAELKLPLTAVPKKSTIERSINEILATGGTEYSPALDVAGQALRAIRNVETKHIIFITDGEPYDFPNASPGKRGYNYYIDILKENNISLSVISILGAPDGPLASTGVNMVEHHGGEGKAYNISSVANLTETIKADLQIDAIKEYHAKEFTPTIKDHNMMVYGIDNSQIPSLGGFYGVKAKEVTKENNLEIPLMGEYTPIYAQWQFGKGKVGSFMCDLKGTMDSWSYKFINDPIGQTLITNMIAMLLPNQSIRLREIDPTFIHDNYTVDIVVNTEMAENDLVEIEVTDITVNTESIFKKQVDVDLSSGIPRGVFVFPADGIYQVKITKTMQNRVAEYITYLEFSYSEEYNMYVDEEETQDFIVRLAASLNEGVVVLQPSDALRDIKWTIPKTFNPRILFLIIIIVFFLIDIAVRKFKFKWPFEMIRDYKLKKEIEKSKASQSKIN